jgi:hypothetical protein
MTVGELRRLIEGVDDNVLIRLDPTGDEDWSEFYTLVNTQSIETEQGDYEMPWSKDATYMYFQLEKEYYY